MDTDQPSSRGLLFLQMIAMFQAAAMQQLGKIPDPTTGEMAKDLEQAKVSIDILEVLDEKTKGNLNNEEEALLEKVLFELRMNYVDELKASTAANNEEQGSEGGGDDADKSNADGQDD